MELILYYGIFIGSCCIIALSLLWINGVLKNRGQSINYLCIMYFSLYVPRSFIGSGGIEAPEFWILLALSISALGYKKKHNYSEYQDNRMYPIKREDETAFLYRNTNSN